MTKIIISTLAAGPEGIVQPGGVMDVSEIEAKRMVDEGNAVYVNEVDNRNSVTKTEPVETMTDEEAREVVQSGEAEIPEAAVVEPQETADLPRPKPRTRKRK